MCTPSGVRTNKGWALMQIDHTTRNLVLSSVSILLIACATLIGFADELSKPDTEMNIEIGEPASTQTKVQPDTKQPQHSQVR